MLDQSTSLCFCPAVTGYALLEQVDFPRSGQQTQIFSYAFSLLSQYDDLLSQFSNMQVAQSSSSHSLSPHESTPPQRSSSNIEQYIHDLDNNSFELDLQFTEEEKQLLLDKQTTGNPW